MSEILEFACDICGQKHRFSAERMGRDADCKACGAPFPVAKHTIAKPDEDEDDDERFDAFEFFRSACVVGLLILVIGGLAWLPFHRPNPNARAVAATGFGAPGTASGNSSSWPPAHGSGTSSWPPKSNTTPSWPPAGNGQFGGGHPGTTPDPAREAMERALERARGAGGQGRFTPFRPGQRPAAQNPVAQNPAAGAPNGAPANLDGEVPAAPNEPNPNAAKPADPQPDANDGDKLAGVPIITSLDVEDAGKTLYIRGSGFQGATRIVPFYVPRWPLTEPKIGSHTDREIRIDSWSIEDLFLTGALVANARGAAVTIPENALMIKNRQADASELVREKLVVVSDGGRLTAFAPTVAVVDGGELQCQSGFGFYFVARGRFTSRSPVEFAVVADGAQVDLPQPPTGRNTLIKVPVLRLCKVRSLARLTQ